MLMRYVLDVIAALGGGGLVAYLLTLRQRRTLLSAQAADIQAQAFAKILDSAGEGLKTQTALVPDLMARIVGLEKDRENDRRAMTEMRDRQDVTSDRLAATQEQLSAAVAESRTLHAYLDALLDWWAEHRLWDEQVMAALHGLGGHVDPPTPIPDRRRMPAQFVPASVPAGHHES
ncbi:MAG TPA: hypothetical protein PKL08_00880 [Thermoanaerobaculaceae bacterium]|nr:hypothetical protein [Thermoanaerobaculaceae bacterium]